MVAKMCSARVGEQRILHQINQVMHLPYNIKKIGHK